MNATREQVAALAKEAANAAKIYIHEEGDAEFLERLVHLAQRFERDRLRAQGVIWVEAVPQCTHKYEIDSDHPNHSCCQNCGEILKDGVHVQPVAQARSRAGMLAAAEMERSKGNDKSTRSVPEDDRNNGIKQLGHIRTHPMDE